jgi:hypothetical protein
MIRNFLSAKIAGNGKLSSEAIGVVTGDFYLLPVLSFDI